MKAFKTYLNESKINTSFIVKSVDYDEFYSEFRIFVRKKFNSKTKYEVTFDTKSEYITINYEIYNTKEKGFAGKTAFSLVEKYFKDTFDNAFGKQNVEFKSVEGLDDDGASGLYIAGKIVIKNK